MTTLSLAMIVKNEAQTLGRVLECAKTFCDELVVVDTGSTDDTVKIAEAMGAKVHHFKWIDDFAAARNASFSHCTGDWIIWLDADDVVPPEEQEKIRALKPQLTDDYDGVFMTYKYTFTPEGLCVFSLPRERIIRRAAGLQWASPVHECIDLEPSRTLKRLDIAIHHHPLPEKAAQKVDRNIKILEKAVAGGDRSVRVLFYYASELRDHQRYEESLDYFEHYLAVSTLKWERHAAMMSMIRCYGALGRHEEALKWCCKAIVEDPTRAEPFNMIGKFLYQQEQWRKAIPFFTAGASLPHPGYGFVSDTDYEYLPYDYLTVCYDRLGEHQTALEMSLKALPNNPEKPRLVKNLHWLISQL